MIDRFYVDLFIDWCRHKGIFIMCGRLYHRVDGKRVKPDIHVLREQFDALCYCMEYRRLEVHEFDRVVNLTKRIWDARS